MKQLPRIILYLFLSAVMLWSIYYVISMTDNCGIDTSYGSYKTAQSLTNDLPPDVAATVQDFGYAFAFRNRFGKSVVVNYEPFEKSFSGTLFEISPQPSVEIYDHRSIWPSHWAFMQLSSGMCVGDVIKTVGLPTSTIKVEGQYISDYKMSNGKTYRIVWKEEKFKNPQHQLGQYRTVVNIVGFRYSEVEKFALVPSFPLHPYITLSVGVITAGIIIFRLKKKGILFKKKQVREQGDSSI